MNYRICEKCSNRYSTGIEEKNSFYKKVMYTQREEPLKAFELLSTIRSNTETITTTLERNKEEGKLTILGKYILYISSVNVYKLVFIILLSIVILFKVLEFLIK